MWVVKTVPTCGTTDTTKDATITFASDETVECNCPTVTIANFQCSELQEDFNAQTAFNEFVTEFSDKIEDILIDDDALKYYALTGDDNTFTEKTKRIVCRIHWCFRNCFSIWRW